MKLYCYKGDYGWSALIKNGEDGPSKYMPLTFKKDEEPKGKKAIVNVEDAFLSTYLKKDGNVEFKLVIMKYKQDYNKK